MVIHYRSCDSVTRLPILNYPEINDCAVDLQTMMMKEEDEKKKRGGACEHGHMG